MRTTSLHVRQLSTLSEEIPGAEKEIRAKEVVACEKHTPAETLKELLSEKPRIINIGLKSFAELLEELDAKLYSMTGLHRQAEM